MTLTVSGTTAGAAADDPRAGRLGGEPLAGALLDVVRLSRQAADADHASLLLVGDDGYLATAASAARHGEEPPWYGLGVVDRVPAGTPELAARAGCDATGLAPLAVARLDVDGELRGALVVGREDTARRFTDAEIAAVDAVAVALRCALAERAPGGAGDGLARRGLLDVLRATSVRLQDAGTGYEVLQLGMEGVLQALGGTSCSVTAVLDDDTVETLASRGSTQPEPGRHPVGAWLDAVPGGTVRRLLSTAAVGVVPRPGRVPADPAGHPFPAGDLLAIPVTRDGRTPAVVVVGFPGAAEEDPVRRAAAAAVAEQSWAAWERVREAERARARIAYHEMLRTLDGEAADVPDLPAMLRRLAPAVRAATGAEPIDAFLCDGAAAKLASVATPRRRLAGTVRAWRRQGARPVRDGGLLLVPMVLGEQVAGVLRVRPVDEPPGAEDMLLALGTAVAAVVARTALRVRLTGAERALGATRERVRLRRDTHADLDCRLAAIRDELRSCAAEATDPVLRRRLDAVVAAVTRAAAELRQAVHALAFLDHAHRGLAGAIRALAKDVSAWTDVSIEVRVTGSPARVLREHEAALFRVAYDSLSRLLPRSRASVATVTLRYGGGRASLVVQDNGTGLSVRAGDQPGLHLCLRTMKQRMDEAGGGLTVTSLRPHGIRVHAWVAAA